MKKSILVILHSGPYSSSQAKEALDIVLAAGTFDQEISFLLSGDACFLLLSGQTPKNIDQKNISQMMKALPMYGIDNIFVDQADAQARNIPLEPCTLSIQALNKGEIVKRIQTADNVLRF